MRADPLKKVAEHCSKSSDAILCKNLRIWHINLDQKRQFWGSIGQKAKRNPLPAKMSKRKGIYKDFYTYSGSIPPLFSVKICHEGEYSWADYAWY